MMYNERAESYCKLVNDEISKVFGEYSKSYENVVKSMDYSLSAGGKRIRPMLVLEFCRLCCNDERRALNFALATEMIHTYSLIHDDLPCMDDDDLRRGKPTNHKIFGEATAILAGDALLTFAFETASTPVSDALISESALVEGISVLSKAAGFKGMIGGQIIDLNCEGKEVSLETITELHRLKTGALISAAAKLGCIAGGADLKQRQAARKYAESLGLAFQIVDDILDVTGDTEKLGKNAGMDKIREKSNFVSVMGIIEAKEKAKELTRAAIAAADEFDDGDFLINLAHMLLGRDH